MEEIIMEAVRKYLEGLEKVRKILEVRKDEVYNSESVS